HLGSCRDPSVLTYLVLGRLGGFNADLYRNYLSFAAVSICQPWRWQWPYLWVVRHARGSGDCLRGVSPQTDRSRRIYSSDNRVHRRRALLWNGPSLALERVLVGRRRHVRTVVLDNMFSTTPHLAARNRTWLRHDFVDVGTCYILLRCIPSY